ncbi:AAA family ATPase [Nocardia sp. NRRL S-836]|uniref:AAA family ATPase n=1 Tax=Nocardia sp. NRRL S-836 TaxID=1519492 RepID=UPI0006B0697B|nr:AAA family ATPase [Nocardia sp. NRRL S-836]KOV80776.1 ATPase AAA [Nocardia sp. NRRL S-836]
MPLLGPADPLPHVPRRILVAGNAGSGKSTLCRRIAGRHGVRYVELDRLYWGPQWTPRPEFGAEVAAFAEGDRWVTEYQYKEVRGALAARADTVVWLDHPFPTVMGRLVSRTVRRRARRVELWNGNQEPSLWSVFTDPEHILRWGWKTYGRSRARVRALVDQVVVVRLSGQGQVERWLDGPLAAVGEERAR